MLSLCVVALLSSGLLQKIKIKFQPGLFSLFLLHFHIFKMQPDVGCVRHEVGPDLTPTGMLVGSAQFSGEKNGKKNSFSMWAKEFYCCELPVNQEITECCSYCWRFKKLSIQPSSSFWSRPLYPELVTSGVTGTMWAFGVWYLVVLWRCFLSTWTEKSLLLSPVA